MWWRRLLAAEMAHPRRTLTSCSASPPCRGELAHPRRGLTACSPSPPCRGEMAHPRRMLTACSTFPPCRGRRLRPGGAGSAASSGEDGELGRIRLLLFDSFPFRGISANLQKSVSFPLSRWRERVRVRVGRSGTHTCKGSRGSLTPALSRRERELDTPLKAVKKRKCPFAARRQGARSCAPAVADLQRTLESLT